MVAEFYPGWLDHWAEPFPQVNAERVARQTEKYLQSEVSVNYYMVHGVLILALQQAPITIRITISNPI
ncbi:hypothetical protein FACS1894169_04560 [Bacteroidia bacterium]|nr:hypothetical protein FACS1894169_04560 [Bacteroidia bacterium]